MKEEPIHILIADQDLMTVSVMERYISAVPGFVVVGIASTLPQLCLLLQKKKIDVIFVEPAGLASDMRSEERRVGKECGANSSYLSNDSYYSCFFSPR